MFGISEFLSSVLYDVVNPIYTQIYIDKSYFLLVIKVVDIVGSN